VRRKPRLLVVGPLPPPVHGVTVSTSLVLKNPLLRERFSVEHVDTSDHRSGGNLGTWDLMNIALGIGHTIRLARRLRARPKGIVYLPLSQSSAGLLRDSIWIQLGRLLGWRLAAHLRGGEFRDFYASRSVLFRAWIRNSLRRLDSVAVMGASLRHLFEGLVSADAIAVVPNGTPDFPLSAQRHGRSVLFLSNLRRRKGVVEAVEAALRVVERDPEARFQFVGEWESRELERDLQERTARYRDRIEFLPAASEGRKLELLASASVFFFPPTKPEGQPRVVLEALCAGLPIVTTDQGAIREAVVDGETGFVLPEADPELLADRILLLLRDDQLRRQMGSAARSRYLAHFTQERADALLADWLCYVAATKGIEP